MMHMNGPLGRHLNCSLLASTAVALVRAAIAATVAVLALEALGLGVDHLVGVAELCKVVGQY